MQENVGTYLFTQGVLGVVCLILGYVCIKLYRKCEALQDKINELYEVRLSDSETIRKEVGAILTSTNENSRILAEKIEVAKQNGRL